MKIGIIHDSLNFAGGAERVALKTIQAIQENGHQVLLGTIGRTDWQRIHTVFGEYPTGYEEVHLSRVSDRSFRIYESLLSPLVLEVVKNTCDFIICTNGELMLLDADISYMHYVPVCFREDMGKNLSELSDLYFLPFRFLQRLLIRRVRNSFLVANSHFTQQALEKFMGRTSEVVYPSVDLKQFIPLRSFTKKQNLVLTVGRYSPEKNFEFVLAVAERLPDISFVIIGTFSGANSATYYRELLSKKKSLNLRNVTLIRDCPYSSLLSMLGLSSVFLSPSVNEHFGLTIIEAMAAGLVPLIHRSGGPWIDMLGQEDGVYGYSYREVAEAAEILVNILSDPSAMKQISSRNLERVRMFSDEAFKSGMSDIVSQKS